MLSRRLFLVTTLLVGFLGSASATVPVAADEAPIELAIVVAKDSTLSELSFHDLKRLYLGEKADVSGHRAIPINFAPLSKDRVGFDHRVLEMSADEAAHYWIARKIRGESGPPITVDSGEVLQRVVARLNGAIGYVRASTLSDQVKPLRIDGKLPGDKDYPVVY